MNLDAADRAALGQVALVVAGVVGAVLGGAVVLGVAVRVFLLLAGWSGC